jgi:hypothetical protein
MFGGSDIKSNHEKLVSLLNPLNFFQVKRTSVFIKQFLELKGNSISAL